MMPDVSVLVYAFRSESAQHAKARAWLEAALSAQQPLMLSDLVLVGTVRILTHPRVFAIPESVDTAIQYVDTLRAHPNVIAVTAGPRFWRVLRGTCLAAGAKGNLASDAQHAALAIEHDCEFVTFDRDYARFAGLKWRTP